MAGVASPPPAPAPATPQPAAPPPGAAATVGAAAAVVTGRSTPASALVTPGTATTSHTATVRATAAVSATPVAAAGAAHLAGGAGPGGSAPDVAEPPGGDGLAHPQPPPAGKGRLERLRIGSHLIPRKALRRLATAGQATGLIVGIDRFQRPVPVRLFRPGPTRVGLVGELETGQLLAFRALAVGAYVVVVTTEPGSWHQFGQLAAGRGDRFSVLTAETPMRLTGTAQRPCLVVYDLGTVGAAVPPPLGRWQTQLTMLRRLDHSGIPVLQDCHLVLLQRMTDPEVALAASALRLDGQHSQLLQVMSDDMLALLGGGTDRYVWLAPTQAEQGYIAAARR